MKTKKLIPLLISLACASSPLLAQSTSIYLQRFINQTGANADASSVGWSLYSNNFVLGANGVNEDGSASLATQLGISGAVGPEVTFDDDDKGYIFMYDDELTPTRYLALSNQAIDLSAQTITRVDFMFRDRENFPQFMQVAVKVGGQWYVSDQVFTNQNTVPATTIWTSNTLNWSSSGWSTLTFDPLDIITLGVNPGTSGSLPAGNIENIGIYFEVGQYNGGVATGSTTLDEFEIYAEAGGAPTWAGYPVVDGYADTGDWLGWVYVGYAPWIYSEALNGWVYIDESAAGVNGAWGYIIK